MPVISPDHPAFTVIVRVKVSPEHQAAMLEQSRRMVPAFQKQPGFLFMAVHRSLDGEEIASYLQWESQAHHEACQASPEVAAAGGEWMEFIQSGKATFEVRTYEVVAAAEAPGR